jgi:hypothetical protein
VKKYGIGSTCSILTEMCNMYEILIGKRERIHLGGLCLYWKIILKWIWNEGVFWVYFGQTGVLAGVRMLFNAEIELI